MKEEINLLPPEAAIERRQRYYILRVNEILRLAIIALLVFFIILTAVQSVTYIVNRTLDSQMALEQLQEKNIYQEIKDINRIMSATNQWVDNLEPTTILLPDILSAMPQSIQLSQMKLDEKDGGITLVGEFTSREALRSYQQKLEALPWVVRLDAPLQNFATGDKESFTFTLYRDDKNQ